MMAVPVMLAACGGGSGSDAPSTGLAAPSGFTVGYGTKDYKFQWNTSAGASRYELFEDPDGPTGPQPEVMVGGANDHTITAFFHEIKSAQLHERVNATYRLRACDGTGCGAFTAAITPDVTRAIGYFKASNGEAIDAFGSAVALSADGRVMAVSATGERSNATCPTTTSCDQADNSIVNAGAVYVFSRNNSYGLWTLASYLKAGNNRAYNNGRYLDNGPHFGASLALSADGSTLVVGAPGETSSAKGVNGDASDTQTQGAGATYVFKAVGSSLPHGLSTKWVQEAYLKASNTRPKADYSVDIMGYYVRDPQSFGSSVAVSSDGNLVAVGAPGEGSKANGINGDQSDNSAIRAGAVYTYSRSSGAGGGNTWAHQAYLKASNTRSAGWQYFGESIALSGDGSTLAVGAPQESSGATGINGNQQDQSASGSGAVYVFTQNNNGWGQQAYVKASNTAARDRFGLKLALSANGNTLAVGAQDESASGTGINNPPGARTLARAGAAYLFTRSNDAWSQQAYLKASNTGQDHWYGSSLALSADGNTLAVGAMAEASSARGINGKQADNSAGGAGAAYVYKRSGGTWSQHAYLKASNTDAGDLFGASIALSGDGTTLAVGATGEDSLAKDIQGNQADNSGSPAYPAMPLPVSVGAVYLY
ncbi:FG-GAP repeat protein [Acidovorax sp. D2M1]|uniref:FG-GAP repeat protein n=1 Tax=Acidovorax benzenivorans TaxID=2987520 RepID=A0ABT5RSK5_9BURK|nr:integrin [Acidovorax benzenivorans]MDD2176685.1 FG-GAP repeat protein [Acidovorax benzenivorans]